MSRPSLIKSLLTEMYKPAEEDDGMPEEHRITQRTIQQKAYQQWKGKDEDGVKHR